MLANEKSECNAPMISNSLSLSLMSLNIECSCHATTNIKHVTCVL